MPWYKWVPNATFSDNANGRVIEQGEVVELSESIAEPQPGFEQVDPPETADETDDDSTDVVDPTEYAVADLQDEVSLSDLSDEQRTDMVALEQSGKDRSSVVEWLEP